MMRAKMGPDELDLYGNTRQERTAERKSRLAGSVTKELDRDWERLQPL